MTKNVKARYIQPPKPIELPSKGGTAAIKTALITTPACNSVQIW